VHTSTHADWLAVAYAAQTTHAVAPSGAEAPTGHAAHTPSSVPYVPEGHGAHSASARALHARARYHPARHGAGEQRLQATSCHGVHGVLMNASACAHVWLHGAHVRSPPFVQLVTAKSPSAQRAVHAPHSASASGAHARAMKRPGPQSAVQFAHSQRSGGVARLRLKVEGGHWHAVRSGMTYSRQEAHAVLLANGA